MTKNPISIDKDALAAKALSIMNAKKITSLCVYNKKNKYKTIGVASCSYYFTIKYILMNRSLVFKIFFISLIVIFILIIFTKFIKKDQTVNSENINKEEIKSNSNIIQDVKYFSKDTQGNEYILDAIEGQIDLSDNKTIFLTKVKALIKLTNGNEINITSEYGKYNIDNYDTIFSKNVIITYLNNKIKGNYLDFSLNRNSMIISKDVIYTNLENMLKADVIEIDIKTKNTKIFMLEDNKKVNIKSIN